MGSAPLPARSSVSSEWPFNRSAANSDWRSADFDLSLPRRIVPCGCRFHACESGIACGRGNIPRDNSPGAGGSFCEGIRASQSAPAHRDGNGGSEVFSRKFSPNQISPSARTIPRIAPLRGHRDEILLGPPEKICLSIITDSHSFAAQKNTVRFRVCYFAPAPDRCHGLWG